MKDTIFMLIRGKTPVDPELEETINESVQGLKRGIATNKARGMLADAGEEVLCHVPSGKNPNKCILFLA